MSTNRTDSMEAARPRGVGRVLWHRNFFPYFAGNMLSNSGTWFQAIAQVLLVYRLTGSEFLVGLVNFSQFAAVLVLAPVAGPAADRFDRRRVIVVTQVAAVLLATTLALLTAADRATAPVVIAVALALGATTAMATPALQAFVPGLVSRSELPAAMALTAVTFNLARALGPVLGVLVIEQWGLATAFAVNALSYVGLIVGIRMVDSHAGQEKPAERPNLRTSVALAARNPVLFLPLAAVGLVSISADPVNTLSPGFSTEIYGRADTFAGVLVGAFGSGAVIAAFTVAGRWKPTYRTIALTLGLMGSGMALFSLSTNPIFGIATIAFGGFGYLASVTAATSLLQLEVPEAHRGRIMALWSLSFHGSRPIASLLDGALATFIGLRLTGALMSLPAFAGCALMSWFAGRKGSPETRAVDPAEDGS